MTLRGCSRVGWLALPLTLLVLSAPSPVRSPSPPTSLVTALTADGTCIECHTGIEDIHPGYALTCIDCHGGDDTKRDKAEAHVRPSQPVPNDERVLPRNHDLAWLAFKNPSNLRVAERVCGDCHGRLVTNLLKSPHGTTAGHLGDGFYEHGLVAGKKPTFSIFPVRDEDGVIPPEAVASTKQVPGFAASGDKSKIATHYSDLPRKACMQCHLWSEGRAVDGRLGLDGDYRGEGCAACHVLYAEDGRSRSQDPTIDKLQPGHPRHHRFTSKIPTSTCTSCHYGDASIGLHFRGMAQLVPGMPAGPDIAGTTDRLLNGVFYIKDPQMTPPDIHHQRGMHCIDCHTARDVMGDGNIYPQMDFAVEIECTSCHGSLDAVTDLTTSRGRRVDNLERQGDRFVLRSKVTGKLHPVKQVKHVIDPQHAHYNARAAAAMTKAHGRLECYTCHNGWNVNFFGFHFDRNEQFTQLDLLSGQRTPGRVTTQEKVFATFNQLRLGFNHEGMIAPYLVGFSTIGSAHDKNGDTILHQATPQTKAGLSGVTMIPHQMHTTTAQARGCVECHRTSVTYGLGSSNFRLTREFGYAIDKRSFMTLAVNGKEPARSRFVASVPLEGRPVALAIRQDPVHARATHAYVAGEDGSLTILELTNPVLPRVLSRSVVLSRPQALLVQGNLLLVADGPGGVVSFDLDKPQVPRKVAEIPTHNAQSLALTWPWLLVADGSGGLGIIDLGADQPKYLAQVDVNGEDGRNNEAIDVAVLFQYSRPPTASRDRDSSGRSPGRSPGRQLAFVACGLDGVAIVDFTTPTAPFLLHRAGGSAFRFSRGDVRGVAVNTVFDIGSAGGGFQSKERDYLYIYANTGPTANRQQLVFTYDVSNPLQPRPARGTPRLYGGTGKLSVLRHYNAPFLQHFVVARGAGGTATIIDVSRMEKGAEITATLSDVRGIVDLCFEEFAFDRLVDERGRWEKDISHEGCRYLTPAELRKVLSADVPPDAAPTKDRYRQTPRRTEVR